MIDIWGSQFGLNLFSVSSNRPTFRREIYNLHARETSNA